MANCTENLTTWDPVLVASTDWDKYPPDIRWTFATWSIYIDSWSNNTCNPYTMNIVELSPWLDTIPQNLLSDNIYRLSAWDYRLTRSVNLASCLGIIWEWDVFIKADDNIWNTFLASWWSKENIIISGLNFDWWYPSYSITGSIVWNWLNNSSLNNIRTYNTYNDWVKIVWDYNLINNLKTYNNETWLSIEWNNNILNNIISYSNINWIVFYNSIRNSVSNSQLFNNSISLNLFETSFNVFSNFSIYSDNDNIWALSMDGLPPTPLWSDNNIFVDFNLYNNNIAIKSILSEWNNYYWTYKLFWNTIGTSWLNPWIWHSLLSDGVLDSTDVYSVLFSTNVSIWWWNSNLPWIQVNPPWTPHTVTENLNLTWPFIWTETYTFGSSIPMQTRPLKYDWATLEYFWIDWNDYDTTKSIWQW